MFRDTIREYDSRSREKHHRYRSWEHCYSYFGRLRKSQVVAHRDLAALHLAFYLASWGMYRGSSFLLQHDYTVHHAVVEIATNPRFRKLRRCDFGSRVSHERLIPLVVDLYDEVEEIYRPFAGSSRMRQPTPTLITKVILGVFGCLPACDRYFLDGWKGQGNKYSSVNRHFLKRLIEFCDDNRVELQREQTRIERRCGIRYPLMKLVDMHFWQLGFSEYQNEG